MSQTKDSLNFSIVTYPIGLNRAKDGIMSDLPKMFKLIKRVGLLFEKAVSTSLTRSKS